jgi:hypothetical protein
MTGPVTTPDAWLSHQPFGATPGMRLPLGPEGLAPQAGEVKLRSARFDLRAAGEHGSRSDPGGVPGQGAAGRASNIDRLQAV